MKVIAAAVLLLAVGVCLRQWPDLWWVAGPLGAIVAWLVGRAGWIRLKYRIDRLWQLMVPHSTSAKRIVRRTDRARRQHGLASPLEVWRHGSGHTVKRKAATLRPELSGKVTAGQVGVELCRVGPQKVYAAVEDVVIAIGGPRTFKTGWMASRVVDYPGPVVTTSTRTDLYVHTHAHRTGGPVWVFNAAGIDHLEPDAVTFDVLTGCELPDVASERAADMIPATTGEAEKWAVQARLAFSALLHAAALGGYSIDTVHAWVAAPNTHQERILRILREKSPSRSTVSDAAQFVTNNENTRSSITTSIVPALKWLQSAHARAAAGLGETQRPFRVEDLLASRGTLYVLGRVEDHVTPLMSAMTGYVARNARRTAARTVHGRLDPPLGLLLDEAHQLKPPLPDWTADMGGSGITPIIATQSRAQLVATWGAEGADIILNNAGAVLLGGGTKATDDLAFWSGLAGKRDERTDTRDGSGRVTSSSQRQVPVLEPAQLANMPQGQVVVFRRGMPPAIGRVRMVWDRRDLRRPTPVETSTSTPLEATVEPTRVETSTPPWRTTPAEEASDVLPQ